MRIDDIIYSNNLYSCSLVKLRISKKHDQINQPICFLKWNCHRTTKTRRREYVDTGIGAWIIRRSLRPPTQIATGPVRKLQLIRNFAALLLSVEHSMETKTPDRVTCFHRKEARNTRIPNHFYTSLTLNDVQYTPAALQYNLFHIRHQIEQTKFILTHGVAKAFNTWMRSYSQS